MLFRSGREVAVVIAPRRFLLGLVVAGLAACDSTPDSTDRAAVSPPAESHLAPAPVAATQPFDAGPVRTPDEYLNDPTFENTDMARGQLLSLACAACHTFDEAGTTLVGPNLHGVFGRRAASVSGFEYSPALEESGLVWTPVSLDAWLQDPAMFVVGTKMAFTGYRSAADRRNLIAYLLHATK